MKALAVAWLVLLLIGNPRLVSASSANTDQALALGQKISLREALQKANAFAEKTRPYWIPFIANEAEIQVQEWVPHQADCWVITFISVKKDSWRRSIVIRVFADGTVDEKPGK